MKFLWVGIVRSSVRNLPSQGGCYQLELCNLRAGNSRCCTNAALYYLVTVEGNYNGVFLFVGFLAMSLFIYSFSVAISLNTPFFAGEFVLVLCPQGSRGVGTIFKCHMTGMNRFDYKVELSDRVFTVVSESKSGRGEFLNIF